MLPLPEKQIKMILRRLFFGLVFLVNYVSLSQNNITAIEYYFDTEPGVGNGIIASVTSGNTINESYSFDTSSLNVGYHFIYIRAKNQNNTWGLYDKKIFYISEVFTPTNPTVIGAEYFIDSEPGAGNGTAISLPTANNNQYSFDIVPSNLTEGNHLLYIRIKSSENIWSLYDVVSFTVDNSLSIDSNVLNTSFGLYPNPTDGFLKINTNHQLKTYKIIDVTGKVFLKNKFTVPSINISKLQSGTYFLIITSDIGTVVKKILKK